MNGLDDCRGRDAGVVHGGGGGDDGDDLKGFAGLSGEGGLRGGEGADFEGKDLVDGEVLRGEDAVEAFEGESAFAVQEV